MMGVDSYLTIPADYGRWLGGLRWSAEGDAVEHAADDPAIGLTFALGAEIAAFVEGLSADGSMLHFVHVLHLLHMLGYGRGSRQPPSLENDHRREFGWLSAHFEQARRPLRNAGALCALLSRGVPRLPDPPPLRDVLDDLRGRRSGAFILYSTHPVEPPLTPEEFRERVRVALRPLSSDDLAHWLRHGRGPADRAGEEVARAAPLTTAELLARLESRPRLKGAAALVARLSGALALPPRRLSGAELPVGGYADVATRGQPEQILPAQLALDPDEFLRRFAARELLYYQREEPHAPTARELVLLVDQGVRTWGDVRIVLAAAALAMARQGDRRGLAIRLATTGNGGRPVDLPGAGLDSLGELLDASDLSAHPAPALERVLNPHDEDGDPPPRDVVVLTHPRSLAEPIVAEAARQGRPGTRLFAVTVDAAGDVALSELRQGAPVALSRCRVVVEDPDAVAPSPAAVAPLAPGSWRGDVEPIGHPFRIGATHPVNDRLFAFDHAGDWLLLADASGMLRAWRTDDSAMEMLPRAMLERKVLADVDAVVGVAGGFVVAGRAGGRPVAAHYDFRTRACTVHAQAGMKAGASSWFYDPEFHSVVAFDGPGSALAINLDTDRARATFPGAKTHSRRAARAFQRAEEEPPGVTVVPPEVRGTSIHIRGRWVCLLPSSGRLILCDGSDAERTTVPKADGRMWLMGAHLLVARWAETTVALLARLPDGRRVLAVFRTTAPEPTLLHEFTLLRDVADFALSHDGRRVAFRTGGRRIDVFSIASPTLPTLSTLKGRTHDTLGVELGRGFLAVQAGRHAHLIRWDLGTLVLSRTVGAVKDVLEMRELLADHPRYGTLRGVDFGVGDDGGRRFYAATPNEDGTGMMLVDRLGQLALLKKHEVVAMFHFFRDQVAAWTPEGARLGPVAVTGGPPTVGADAAIAEALARWQGPG